MLEKYVHVDMVGSSIIINEVLIYVQKGEHENKIVAEKGICDLIVGAFCGICHVLFSADPLWKSAQQKVQRLFCRLVDCHLGIIELL